MATDERFSDTHTDVLWSPVVPMLERVHSIIPASRHTYALEWNGAWKAKSLIPVHHG
jgi:hypothetical protein